MSIDMSQFYQVFFEESAENLASMESLLLAIDLDAPDLEQLNAIFRAAHSIKGGSSTFGFNDMAEVTHVLETLLDGIRKEEIRINAEMVGAILQAGDVLKGLLEGHRNGTVVDPAPSVEICARLARLSGRQGKIDARQNAEPMAITPAVKKKPEPLPALYRINFAKSPAIFRGKEELDNLLKELGNTGRIEKQEISAESVTLTLSSSASESELRETFAFFLQPDQFTIVLSGEQKKDVEGYQHGLVSDSGMHDEDMGYGFFVDVERKMQAATPQQAVLHEEAPKPSTPRPSAPQIAAPPLAVLPHAEEPQVADKAQNIAPAAETSIRVSVGKVDQMINLVGELVITKSILAEIVANMDPVLNEPLVRGLVQLESNTRELQEAVMSVRMMPINFVFSRFPRLVRDLAVKLDKKAQFRMIGEGTELDKGLIEKISDPLIHLVRNSMDHGIESPQERIAIGKDPQGTITMSAAHQGGNIVIRVSDDGAGLNRKLILAKAREKGIPFDDNISDADAWQMIFAPGFSTAAVVTDVSGRGVGMDVVKREIESIGGRVEISSSAGMGSSFTIRLPLTLAILDGLSIAVGDQLYIVPLSFIIESLQPRAADVKEICGHGRVLQVRGEYLPMISLHEIFRIQSGITRPEDGILVLLEADGNKVALLVDKLVSQHQVVIKSLETNYRKVTGISGATIMGDGRVAMILDVGAIVKMAQQQVIPAPDRQNNNSKQG